MEAKRSKNRRQIQPKNESYSVVEDIHPQQTCRVYLLWHIWTVQNWAADQHRNIYQLLEQNRFKRQVQFLWCGLYEALTLPSDSRFLWDVKC